MELQTLQEALKVEIQIHQKLVTQMKQDPQNIDLKKRLHELQAKITALSERQKKVVEQLRKDLLVKQGQAELRLQGQQQMDGMLSTQLVQPDGRASALLSAQAPLSLPAKSPCPQQTVAVATVITAKTLPLVLKSATAAMPTSLVTHRPTIAMVKAISNISKSNVINSQNTPVNLQTSGSVSNQGAEAVHKVSKNAIAVKPTTAQPIKVPQFIPPPRLTHRPNLLPQVRPKSIAPNNVPITPAPPPMAVAPRQVKLNATSVTSSTGPVHQMHVVNGQPCPTIANTLSASQLPDIIISTPAAACQTALQPLQVNSVGADTKIVKAQGGTDQKVTANDLSCPTPTPPLKPKHEEDPQKLAFMMYLGLVTHDHLEEIQSRRQERKRRTTANPVYSGAVFEPERKKSTVSYLNTHLLQGTRKRGRPPKYTCVSELGFHTPTSPSSSHPASPAPDWPEMGGSHFPVHPHTLPLPSPSPGDGDVHEDFCAVCCRSGQLLMCDTCSHVYHLDCLEPPLKSIPRGMWICPKCQDQILKKEEAIPWPGTLAIVHSYIAYKAAKEEEKQKLEKWSSELKREREELERRVKQLSNSITKCTETKNTTLARQKEMHASLERVKNLVSLIQGANLMLSLKKGSLEIADSGPRDSMVSNINESCISLAKNNTGTESNAEENKKDEVDNNSKTSELSQCPVLTCHDTQCP